MEVLTTVLLAIGLGRLGLSFLPPGRPGSHEVGELPRTLAFSLLLGLLVVRAYATLFEMAPLPLAIACSVLVFVRLSTLPGAMVPPQPRMRERRSIASLLLMLAALCVPWLVQVDPGNLRWLNALCACAALLVLDATLEERVQRGILRRSGLLALALLLPFLPMPGGAQAIPWGAVAWLVGTGLAVGWFARADRRQGALCALALAFGGDLDVRANALLAAAALVLLVVLSAAPSRRWIGSVALAAFALRLALTLPLEAPAVAWSLAAILWPLLPAVLLAVLLVVTRRPLATNQDEFARQPVHSG